MRNKDLLTKSQRLLLIKEQLLTSMGGYGKYGDFNPAKVCRTVFVCKGNICRSALAESYMMRHGESATSFGLECTDGNPADPTMLRIAAQKGVLLQDHKTRSLNSFQILEGDLLVAMEPRQIRSLQRMKHQRDHVQFALLGMFLNPASAIVADPYGKEDRFFEEVISSIFSGVDNIYSRFSQS